jgi:hypothetical protein
MKWRTVVAVLATIAACSLASAQAPAPESPGRPAILKAARELMEKARYCALVTIGGDGHPQARTIDAGRSVPGHEVKAVTYHELAIRPIPGGFEATYILDI